MSIEAMRRLGAEAENLVVEARTKMTEWKSVHKDEVMPADVAKQIDDMLDKAAEKKSAMDKLFGEVEQSKRLDLLTNDLNAVVNRIPLTSNKGPDEIKTDDKLLRAVQIKGFMGFLNGGVKRTQQILTPELKALGETVDTEGGYLVPDDFRAMVIRKLANKVNIRAAATVLTTSRESIPIPEVATEQGASWTAENAAITMTADEVFAEKRLHPWKLTRGTKVSNELIGDSAINILDLLSTIFADKFVEAEDTAFIEGTGQGQAEGVKVSSVITTYTPSTTSFTAEKLIDMTYQLKAQYRQSAKWLIRRSNIALVRKMTANSEYIWNGNNLVQGQPPTLLGYPIMETERLDAYAQYAIPCVFGDWSYYWIADRADFRMVRLTELYAANDQVGLIAIKRTDGAPVMGEAFCRLSIA